MSMVGRICAVSLMGWTFLSAVAFNLITFYWIATALVDLPSAPVWAAVGVLVLHALTAKKASAEELAEIKRIIKELEG